MGVGLLMPEYVIIRASSDELYHHGVKGQKHGVRQYQNADGSLTPEGREHYGIGQGRDAKYQNPDGSLTNDGKARLARSQRYVDSKSKTAGQRVRRTIGAGLVGGLVPGLAGAAGLTGLVAGKTAATYGLAQTLSALGASGIGALASAGAISAAPLIAAGALGGLAIAGIKHGVQAAKVRRGQNFIDKFGLST